MKLFAEKKTQQRPWEDYVNNLLQDESANVMTKINGENMILKE